MEEPKHYDNSKGSLYQFCDNKLIHTNLTLKKVRDAEKGKLLEEDLEKTKFLIDLYIKEQSTNQN
jgi:hypothetical protein